MSSPTNSGPENACYYLNAILRVSNQPLSVLLASLSVLEQALFTDKTSTLLQCAALKDLCDALFAIIKKPCYKYNENETQNAHTAVDCSRKVFSNHPLLYTLTLKCIELIAKRIYEQKLSQLIDKDSLHCLLRFLQPKLYIKQEVGCSFYQFPNKFSRVLSDLIKHSEGRIKFKAGIDRDVKLLMQEILFYNSDQVKIDQRVTTVKCLQVKICSDMSETNVVDYLLSQKLAWRGVQPNVEEDVWTWDGRKSKQESPKDDSRERLMKVLQWKEARITHILDGNFFWALLGIDAIQSFDALSTTLANDLEISKLKPVVAQAGKAIAAVVMTAGKKKVFRAQILNTSKGVITVFCVDTGAIYKISSSCVLGLPGEFSLSELAPLASLARIDGLSPPPLDTRAVKYAISTLTYACRFNATATNILLESDLVPLFPTLLQSPEKEIVLKTLGLVTNVLFKRSHPFNETWAQTLFIIVELLSRYVQQKQSRHSEEQKNQHSRNECSSSSSTDESIGTEESRSMEDLSTNSQRVQKNCIVPCLLAVANRIFMNRKARDYFYQIQGIDVVLRVFQLHYKDWAITQSVIKVLANYVHVVHARSIGGAENARSQNQGKAISQEAPDIEENSFEQTEPINPLDILDLYEDDDGDDDVDVEENDDSGLGDSRNGTGMFIEGDVKIDKVPDFYVYGSTVPFNADATHELFQSAQSLVNELVPILCGMLNTGQEGKIYLGISENSKVVGEKISHDARDEIRLGVDTIMRTKLMPPILHSQFHLKYTPVVNIRHGEDGSEHLVPCVDLYVVEITCKPVPKMTYCCKGDKCFYRAGAATLEISQQDIRQMIVIDEEVMYKDHIGQLKRELEELRMEYARI